MCLLTPAGGPCELGARGTGRGGAPGGKEMHDAHARRIRGAAAGGDTDGRPREPCVRPVRLDPILTTAEKTRTVSTVGKNEL